MSKLPITDVILKKIYSHYYQPKHGRDGLRASVALWWTVRRIYLEYHTLGRFSDISKLKRGDVVYDPLPSAHLRVLVKGGKNDQYSEGGERVVASNSDASWCPVRLTLNYFQFLGPNYVCYLDLSFNARNAPNPEKSCSVQYCSRRPQEIVDLVGVRC